MSRYILVIFFISLVSCSQKDAGKKQGDNDSTLLSTSLVNNPHTAGGLDTAAMSTMATMDFTDTFHNFGTVHEGETVVYEFDFVEIFQKFI